MIRTTFFNVVRSEFGALKQDQVDGFNLILDEASRRSTQLDFLAYILATTWWETAKTMQPIREFGKGKGRKYGMPHPKTGQVYYGRGYVQLTWYENYLKASTKLGTDFVTNPDLVMVPAHAVRILFDGMLEGWFTGKDLDDYLDGIDEDDAEDLREFSNARRIINGTDKQVVIGEIALVFEKALRQARYGDRPVIVPTFPKEPETAPQQAPKRDWLAILLSFIRGLRR